MEESTTANEVPDVPPQLIPEITEHLLIDCGASREKARLYVGPLTAHLAAADVTTPLRFCHLLAQLLHESDDFRTAQEYASGKAYEGRKDLGNVNKGDGVRYKGRGSIQCTGRRNYAAASKALGVDYISHPEWMERPDDAIRVSLWYWTTRNLNYYADRDDVLSISQVINMGSVPKVNPKLKFPNGWIDRQKCLARCKSVVMAPKPSKTKTVHE